MPRCVQFVAREGLARLRFRRVLGAVYVRACLEAWKCHRLSRRDKARALIRAGGHWRYVIVLGFPP
jgi:hypothetical protein